MENFDEEFLNDLSMGAPHVVILGAGASLASFPAGDKNGKKLPLMADLIEVVGIDKVLGDEYLGKNIEDVFSDLSKDSKNEEMLKSVESMIFKYFSDFEISEEPTIYDYLLLSLRGKDLIASFNWDPLLFQAAQRNYMKAELPKIVYLHGNVAVGHCDKCRVYAQIGGKCLQCGQPLKDSELLYPIGEKDYDKNPFIQSAWAMLSAYLERAYILTIFGYRAPESDYKAMEIFKEAWGPAAKREFEEIEIIHRPGLSDKEKDSVTEPWNDLIHTHHYSLSDTIYHSEMMMHPRRSCDALWSALMMCEPRQEYPVPQELTLDELGVWIKPLVDREK